MKKILIALLAFAVVCTAFVTVSTAKTDIRFDISDGGHIDTPAPEQVCITMTDGGDLDTPAPQQAYITITDGGDIDSPAPEQVCITMTDGIGNELPLDD